MKSLPYIFLLSFIVGSIPAGCNLIFLPRTPGIVTSPSQRNQILKHNDKIFLRFDFSPDRSSAEGIFSIKDFSGNVTGRVSWEDNTMYFNPEGKLVQGRRYTLNFMGEMRDTEGRKYDPQIIVPFFYGSTEEPPPEILSITPQEGERVSCITPVVIRFSREMDEGLVKHKLTINPNHKLHFYWNESRTEVTIKPDQSWDNLTLYTLNVPEDIKDRLGIPLTKGVKTTFFVEEDREAPEIISIKPAINDLKNNFPDLERDLSEAGCLDAIKITFSEPMERDKTESAFSILPGIESRLFWTDNKRLVLVPESGFVMGYSYTLNIRKSAEDLWGNTLLNDLSVSFTPKTPSLKLLELGGFTEDGFPLSPPFSGEIPVDIDTGLPPHNYTFTFTFNLDFSTDEEKLNAQRSVDIACIFPPEGGSPIRIGQSWTGHNRFSITFSGFTPSDVEKSYYYLLTIRGGEEGIKNKQGSFLLEDKEILLRTKS